jgi:hypothetical protein
VRGRISIDFTPILSNRDDDSLFNEDTANRYVLVSGGILRRFKRDPHELFIARHTNHVTTPSGKTRLPNTVTTREHR